MFLYPLVKIQNGLIPDNSVLLAMGKVDLGLYETTGFTAGGCSIIFICQPTFRKETTHVPGKHSATIEKRLKNGFINRY